MTRNVTTDCRVNQGDIFSDVDFIEDIIITDHKKLDISLINFPFIFVLTQDCDLETDYMYRFVDNEKNKMGSCLFSVIVVPVYNFESFLEGKHLEEIGRSKSTVQSDTEKSFIKSNQLSRYHYLDFSESKILPDSIIDFKHYFTVNIDYLIKQKFVCNIGYLQRESVTLRFSNYLSRIGLPKKQIMPKTRD